MIQQPKRPIWHGRRGGGVSIAPRSEGEGQDAMARRRRELDFVAVLALVNGIELPSPMTQQISQAVTTILRATPGAVDAWLRVGSLLPEQE
jgi:hypothetical protein